eukprot:s2276_g10.t1
MAFYLALGTRPWNVFGGCGSCLARESILSHEACMGAFGPEKLRVEEGTTCRRSWVPGRSLGECLFNPGHNAMPDVSLGEKQKGVVDNKNTL